MSKFADKFLGILKLDNEYDEYDDYDEYDEDEYEEKPKKSYKPSKESKYEEEEDDFDDEKPVKQTKNFSKSSKVVQMRSSGRSISNMEVCVIKPKTVEDSKEITDTLLSGRAVILNLEGLHVDMAQRIVDFTSGSCYSMSGNLKKVSNYIFIITPESVDISGDFQELFEGGFEVAAFQ